MVCGISFDFLLSFTNAEIYQVCKFAKMLERAVATAVKVNANHHNNLLASDLVSPVAYYCNMAQFGFGCNQKIIN